MTCIYRPLLCFGMFSGHTALVLASIAGRDRTACAQQQRSDSMHPTP